LLHFQKEIIEHLFNIRYDYERARQDVRWIEQSITDNKVIELLDSIEISLPSSIQSITDMNLHQQLSDRHRKSMQQYKNEMLLIFIDAKKAKLHQYEKILNDETEKIRQNQLLLPIDERLNRSNINIIERYLILITEKVEWIYLCKNILPAN